MKTQSISHGRDQYSCFLCDPCRSRISDTRLCLSGYFCSFPQDHQIHFECLFNKTNRRTYFPNVFLSRNYMFRAVPLPIIRSFPLVFSSTSRMEKFLPGRAWKLSTNLHDIYQCRMYSGKLLMMDGGTARNMKIFLTKMNLEKSVRLLVLLKIYLLRCTVTWR